MRHVIIVLFMVGCSFDGGQGGTTDAGADLDADADVDADVDAMPIPLGDCGKPGALRGSFSDNEDEWRTEGDGALVVSGELLELSQSSVGATAFVSRKTVDGTDAATTIAITEFPDGSEEIRGEFGLVRDRDNVIGIRFTATEIESYSTVNAQTTVIDTVGLSQTDHQFLRIREAAGMVFFETSPDGQAYTALGQMTTPTFVASSALGFRIVRTGNSGSSNAAVGFAGLNNLVPRARWCPAATLMDSFNGGTLPWRLAALPADGNRCDGPQVAGGTADVSQSSGAGATECRIETATGYELTSSTATIEVDDISTFRDTWRTYFELVDVSGTKARLFFFEDQMCVEVLSASNMPIASELDTCITYMGNDHLFWRWAQKGAELVAEVSGDQVTWTDVARGSPPFSLDALRLRFGTVSTSLPISIGLGVSAFNPSL